MLLGKAKICQKRSPVVQENISEFEVAMQKTPIGHFYEASYYILHKFQNLRFCQSSFLFQMATQISFIAVFGYDITV